MARVELPPPRPVLWPLRPRESAQVWITRNGGQAGIVIEHAPLRAVTGEMLTWWYGHVPGTMAYAGRTYPRYLVWHPLDHISYQLVRPGSRGGIGPGAEVHITEALGRDPANVIDIRATVEELRDGRAVIGRRVAGTSLVRIENEWEDGPAGATYTSRMTIGDRTPLGRLILNQTAHRKAFPPRRVEPWIRHHIEEVGNLEHFLPKLFATRVEHEPTQL